MMIIIINNWIKVIIEIVILLHITLIIVGITNYISLNYYTDYEKASEYECGFEPFDNAIREPFDVHFFLIGIIFLVFDIEIALLIPWIFADDGMDENSFIIGFFYLWTLIISLYYEVKSDNLRFMERNT